MCVRVTHCRDAGAASAIAALGHISTTHAVSTPVKFRFCVLCLEVSILFLRDFARRFQRWFNIIYDITPKAMKPFPSTLLFTDFGGLG